MEYARWQGGLVLLMMKMRIGIFIMRSYGWLAEPAIGLLGSGQLLS